jgi:hypothetical protein
MTDIQPVVEIPEGDTRRLPFDVNEPDDSPQPLTGADLEWRLGDENDPALSTADSGVTVVDRDDTAGTFVVKLSANATDSIRPGTYQEVVTITDTQGRVTQFVGRVRITPV